MNAEEYHFWSEQKTRFWIYLSITVAVAAIIVFSICCWMVYQQKEKVLGMDSKQKTPTAATPLNDNNDPTNTAQPSLAPELNPN